MSITSVNLSPTNTPSDPNSEAQNAGVENYLNNPDKPSQTINLYELIREEVEEPLMKFLLKRLRQNNEKGIILTINDTWQNRRTDIPPVHRSSFFKLADVKQEDCDKPQPASSF